MHLLLPQRRRRPARFARVIIGLLVVVLLGGLLSSCGSSGPSVLRVDRNILEVGGHRWIARGVADYVLPFYTTNGRADPYLARFTAADFSERAAIFHEMVGDGVNVVRIPVGLEGVVGDRYGIGGLSAYVSRLTQVVRSAERAGLRVLIGWWDSTGQGSGFLGEYRRLFPMMGAVARALRNDRAVMFEPYNEPGAMAWLQWSAMMAATIREWRSVFGYRGPLVLDTIDYSWAFSPPAARALQLLDAHLLRGPSQLVFANHRYPDGSSCFCGHAEALWQASIGRWASKFPILGTEYGPTVLASRPTPPGSGNWPTLSRPARSPPDTMVSSLSSGVGWTPTL